LERSLVEERRHLPLVEGEALLSVVNLFQPWSQLGTFIP
jgi:hypothetical protein